MIQRRNRTALGVALLLAALAGACAARPIQRESPPTTAAVVSVAPKLVRVQGLQLIDKVRDDGRVELAVGTRHGLVLDVADHHIYAQRKMPGGYVQLDGEETLAWGRAETVGPDRTVLRLLGQGEPFPKDVQLVLAWSVQVPEPLAKEPLVKLLALGCQLLGYPDKKPLVALSQLQANPQKGVAEAHAALAASAQAAAGAAKEFFPSTRLPAALAESSATGRRLAGSLLHEAFAATTPGDIAAFLAFADRDNQHYAARSVLLIDLYAQWLLQSAPHGAAPQDELAPVRAAAKAAAARGDLHEAERQWQAVQQARPRDPEATGQRAIIARIRNLQVQLEAEPDREEARWYLVYQLSTLGADGLVLRELEVLREQGADALKVDRWRASVLRAAGKWQEALALYESIWRRSGLAHDEQALREAEARHKTARNDADQAAWCDAAEVFWRAGNFAEARSHLENCRRAASDPAVWADALRRERLARRAAQGEREVAAAAEALERWEVAEALKQFSRGVEALREAPAALNKATVAVFDAAGNLGQMRTMAQLAQHFQRAAPKDVDALFHEAFARKMLRQPDEALQILARAEALEPTNSLVFWMRVGLLLARGQTAEARAASQRLLQVDARSTQALMLAARVAVAEGRYEEARLRAERAWAKRHESAITATALLEREDVEVAAEAAKWLERNKHKQPTDPEVQRWRATLALALVDLELPQQAMAEAARLPRSSAWYAEVAEVIGGSHFVSLAEAILWSQRADTGELFRSAWLAKLQAEAALSAQPDSAARAAELAQACVDLSSPFEARAALAEVDHVRAQSPAAEQQAWKQALARTELAIKAATRLQQAKTAAERDEDAEALRLAEEAMQVAAQAAMWPTLREAAIQAASSAEVLGQYTLSIAHAEQGVAAARRWGDPADISQSAEVLAHVQARAGNLSAWPKALQQVRDRCADRGRLNCVSGVERRLAELAWQEGRLADATRWIASAAQQAERAGAAKTYRSILSIGAGIFRAAGNLQHALTWAGLLRDEAAGAGATAQLDRALLLLAAISGELGDAAAAERWFAEAERSTKGGANPMFAIDIKAERGLWQLDGLGNAKAARPQLAAAVAEYARRGNLRQAAEWGVQLARAEWQLGLAEDASRTAAAAESRAVQTGRLGDALHAARLRALASRDRGVAEAAAVRAVERADQQAQPAAQALAWHARGVVLQRAGDLAGSVAAFGRAVAAAVQEAVQQTNALPLGARREREALWSDAVAAAVALQQPERVLQWSALSRAVLSRQSRAVAGSATDPAAEAALSAYVTALQQEQAASNAAAGAGGQAESAAWQDRAGAARNTATEALARIRREHRRLFAQVAIEPETLRALLPKLPPKTLILQYFAAKDRLYIFAVGGSSAALRVKEVKVPWPHVERGVLRWRQRMLASADRVALRGASALDDEAQPLANEPTAATELEVSQPLYDWLLAPVQDDLAAAETTLVLPFGALYYLPLHGLLHQTAAGERYVLEDHRIGYLSGTTASALGSRGPRPKQWRLLGIGNPDGTLPGAREELRQIARLVSKDSVIWLNEAGKGEAFLQKAPGFDVLHLATHGVLKPDPAASHLKMADGPLTLVRIAGSEGLDKRPRLVVLSACSTALQPGQAPGDEVASLATAFAVAGVPSLLATLWDVDDEATALLMTGFYRELGAGKSTLEALRQAQLALLTAGRSGRAQLASPAAWAALHLLGDPR